MAEILGVLSSIVAVLELSGTVINYVHKLKSASTDCNRILLELSTIAGFLSSLKELISKAESQDVWLDTVRSLDLPKGPMAQYALSLEQLERKLKPLAGWKKAGKAVRWPFEKNEILEILASIERQKTLFILALENDNVKLTLAIKVDMADIKRDLSQISAEVDDIGAHSKDQHMATIYEWLDPLSGDFEKKQMDVFNLNGRQDGVCKWLLKTKEFTDWISGTNKTLWCSGAPGIGKTVISSFIVHHLQLRLSHSEKLGVIFLYCNYKDSDKQTIRNMVANILHQLALQNLSISTTLEAMYDQHKHRGSLPMLSELLDHLRSASAEFETLFVVVDALDEYAQESLDDLLSSLHTMSPIACYFFTSRPNIQLALKDMVHLKIQAHATDIEDYLTGRIEESKTLSSLVRKDSTLKVRIVETVIEKAKGM